ncbi:MAG TPA: hypothetical protein PKH07_19265, partial [bacterium]|nr:hypothetical protein [bacterium]
MVLDQPKRITLRNIALVLALTVHFCVSAQATLSLVPAPKHVSRDTTSPLDVRSQSVAIVLGDKASEPEVIAAETLASNIGKSFSLEWHIRRESESFDARILIHLGQKNTSSEIETFLSTRNIKVNANEDSLD